MSEINKIISLLQEQNKTQKELTDYLGLDKSTFTAWKNGKSRSYKKFTAEIAEFFGVSADYLLGLTDDPIDYENSDEVLNARSEIIDYFDGDAERIYAFQKAVEQDALSERIEKPKLRSIARLENCDFTPEEDDQILDFINYIRSKRGE